MASLHEEEDNRNTTDERKEYCAEDNYMDPNTSKLYV